ncbi:histidine phosphatase superfamily [Pyrenochaeta sp. MPI-SDFR-AT-0127]|nr:histidine phosphatase superfamily [Pyrenochaeta sp. MPI-SDFR-AT-0127]
MSGRTWKYVAQHGYFSHDQDPENSGFEATTRPGLGILHREYPTDLEFDPNGQQSDWERLKYYVTSLNQKDPEHTRYKMLYIARHGEGFHNVKVAQVGWDEWERKWSKEPGDGTITWLDADLTPKGEQQAHDIAKFWESENIPPPESIYSSPLQRCLHTTALAFVPFLNAVPGKQPVVKEKLRERLSGYTCDQRSSKTWITDAYPSFSIEDGFTENDELWLPDRRETSREHVKRSKELLNDLFSHDDSNTVAMTAHSGTIMAIFAATGWKEISVAAGAVYPLLVRASKT